MSLLTLTYHQFTAWMPSHYDRTRVVAALGGSAAWGNNPKSMAQMRAAGVEFDAVLCIAGYMCAINPDILRCCRLFGADCCAHTLQFIDAKYTVDGRLRHAINQIRLFARGQSSAFDLGTLSLGGDAASAVWWALPSKGDALTSSTGGLAARYRAKIEEPNADAAAAARAWIAEREWQYDRLVTWLSASEPADWPI
jgi:hypothetical protein